MDNFKAFFEEYDRLRFEYRLLKNLYFFRVEKPHTLISRINLYRNEVEKPSPSVLQLFGVGYGSGFNHELHG